MKKITALLTALLLALSAFPCPAPAEEAVIPTDRAREQEALLKSAESYTKVVNILGKNYLYFAQNSPEWTQLFSQEGRRNNLRFGDSGCAIAAFANACVNVLPMERLREIDGIMQSPVYVDTFCLARRYGKDEDRFLIESDADRLRFWPLTVANMAAGNNTFHFRTDRSPGFYKYVLDHFGLRYLYTPDVETTLAALREGAVAVSCSSGNSSPISIVGHFFTLVAADDEYVYILDSYVRDRFKRDSSHVIEIVEPGVLRVALKNLRRVGLQTQRIIWPAEGATHYTPELLEEIIRESDAQVR